MGLASWYVLGHKRAQKEVKKILEEDLTYEEMQAKLEQWVEKK